MHRTTLLFLYSALLQYGLSSTRYEAPFGCPRNYTLTDAQRAAALSVMNAVRSVVAQGQFPAFLESSGLMNKLAWNCNLEILAQRMVRGCAQSPVVSLGNGFNYGYFRPDAPIVDRTYPLQRTILEWTFLQDTWPRNNIFDGKQSLLPFANLILANSASVGCSLAKCNNGSAAACVFSETSILPGRPIYISGSPCENGQSCTVTSPGVCENALCVIPRGPSTTKSTTTTTTTTISTTTTPTTTTTITTTTKRRSTDCRSRAFPSTFREVALGMHNNFRSLVARGLARNGEYANENAPPASRMDLMEYDCNAEQLALNHVRLCDRQPAPASVRPGHSENIHVLATTATDLLGAIQNAIGKFTAELGVNGIPSHMVLMPHVVQRTQKTVTRVSKVLWSSNRWVGCATQLCSGFYFTSCMYRDPVNVVGSSIYPIGAVCSACPTGPNNCHLGIGLCSY